MRAARTSPLAVPIDLRRARRARPSDLIEGFHPAYAEAIARLPAGATTWRGLPFAFARGDAPRRWLLLDRPVDVELDGIGPISHLVVAHFCDAWRDPVEGRPADLPIGWVTPVGQPLARYTVELASGSTVKRVVRRRFEINDGIVGWGQGAFAALPHLVDAPLDWRGPHPVLTPSGYAEPGEAGLLAILPGSWGSGQTGVADSVPSPTGNITFWLYALEIPQGGRPTRLHMEPLASIDEGSGVVVGAVTAFSGTASPLSVQPRRTLRIERPVAANGPADVSVDLGQIFRQRPAPPSTPATDGEVIGWGTPPQGAPIDPAILVDLAFAPDATLSVGATLSSGGEAAAGGEPPSVRSRHDRAPADPDPAARGRDRRPRDGRPRARSGPLRRARWSVPPTARASRRGQSRPERGLRG